MLERLLEIDHTVFVFVNQSLANPVTDFLMPIITNDTLLRILLAVALIALLALSRGRLLWVAVASLLVVALTDQSASAILKPLIGRLRPCKIMEVHLLVTCGAGLSFPSSHAANLFGQAIFFGLLHKKYLPYTVGFAFLVGVSRISVGVHYPLDVLAGAVLGGVVGLIMAWVVWMIRRHTGLRPSPILDSVFDRRPRNAADK